MHHLEEEEFYFPYMYYFNIFINALSDYDAILRTFQLPLVKVKLSVSIQAEYPFRPFWIKLG